MEKSKPESSPMIEPEKLHLEIARTQVVVLAGGRAKRMGTDLPKCLLEVSGKKLIDWCIESLTKEGFREFVFLLGHKHELVTEHIGDGRRYGIKVRYSVDPPSNSGLGKGKALKYALQNNRIDRSRRSIITFPDDIMLEENVYSRFLSNHIKAVCTDDVFASIILVPGTEYPYGVAKVDSKGRIVKFTEKPLVRKPTSTGTYAFEPKVYEVIEERINLQDPNTVEFESAILPILSKDYRLSSFFIGSNKWLPINTLKEYGQAIKVLARQI